ncbi:hypothetical protein H5410_014722 [Solanum commersonii]|uniref:Uncharacterized protein n=1 Tax=Solanum commersonii TaxID=4109 RepID=A0A9J5ZS83_SOLCO|nr:hypothetical protein H5410_014722 [Solanum commersonii]
MLAGTASSSVNVCGTADDNGGPWCRCVQAKGDVGRQRPTSADQVVQATYNAARPRLSSADRCVQGMGQLASPRRRRLTDVCRPRTIQPVHIQRYERHGRPHVLDYTLTKVTACDVARLTSASNR